MTEPGKKGSPSIGIVVPVFNEAKTLEAALRELAETAPHCPVAVVDGGSSDGSADLARRRFPTHVLPKPNRGEQMNHGAGRLDTDVLLFLHADSRLPRGFDELVRRALEDGRVAGGCFQLKFDARHPMLRFYSWCTRFSGRFFHFGDQGFFVRREVFRQMGGYRNSEFLEDVDFLKRLRRYGRFAVLPAPIVTSARRFQRRGIYRQQLVNILLVTLSELGLPAERLARFYPLVR